MGTGSEDFRGAGGSMMGHESLLKVVEATT